jgi:hydroxymethylglutaryl-CoA reductase (NADPH)
MLNIRYANSNFKLFLILVFLIPKNAQAMWRKGIKTLLPPLRAWHSDASLRSKPFGHIFKDLKAGHLKSHQLESRILRTVFNGNLAYGQQAINVALAMRQTLKVLEGVSLNNIPKHSVARMCDNGLPNIENQLGGSVYPLCDAGALKIHGQYAHGAYPLLLTTHECALPAGMKRGAKLINMVGGVQAVVTHSTMTRAPLIQTPSIQIAHHLVDIINNNKELFAKMAAIVTMKSKVTKLIGVKALQDGRDVHMRLVFDTGDCMGMNSATLYGSYVFEVLKYYFPDISLVALSGNLCSDKKQTHANIWEGRGVGVEAEVEIPERKLNEVYKSVTPATIADINIRKNLRGSALAGTLGGFNANAANALAAMFLSTGQDAAQLVESSSAFTRASVAGNGHLVFGVKLPCLEIATTGGGVGSETSREYLEILGCYGPGAHPGDNKKKLAEIIAGAVLAQELNLLATLANNYELAESHASLARGRISNVPEEVKKLV